MKCLPSQMRKKNLVRKKNIKMQLYPNRFLIQIIFIYSLKIWGIVSSIHDLNSFTTVLIHPQDFVFCCYNCLDLPWEQVQFRFSKKATKFETISHLIWTLLKYTTIHTIFCRTWTSLTKGQLISERNFYVFKPPKNETNF